MIDLKGNKQDHKQDLNVSVPVSVVKIEVSKGVVLVKGNHKDR